MTHHPSRPPGRGLAFRVGASLRRLALLGFLAAPAGCSAPPPKPAPPPPAAYPPLSSIHVTCPHVPAPPKGATLPTPPPSAPQMLFPGHWDWSDGEYVWTQPQLKLRPPGLPPGPPPVWQDGAWEVNGGACVWHNGHFRPAGRSGAGLPG